MTKAQNTKHKRITGEKKLNSSVKRKELEDVHSAIRQVTTVVNIQLWSSDKALKLFQKASGVDRSGLGCFSWFT